ncbi:MAG: TrkA C-terminal domain-containing protein, partial [Ruminococcus sp.]|nr:TrkA C-terminal domain-containing protein [Ruminococcus sp.]
SDIAEIGEVLVDKKSDFKNMTVAESSEKYNISILVILRGELTVVPNENMRIRQNDILIVRSDKIDK